MHHDIEWIHVNNMRLMDGVLLTRWRVTCLRKVVGDGCECCVKLVLVLVTGDRVRVGLKVLWPSSDRDRAHNKQTLSNVPFHVVVIVDFPLLEITISLTSPVSY